MEDAACLKIAAPYDFAAGSRCPLHLSRMTGNLPALRAGVLAKRMNNLLCPHTLSQFAPQPSHIGPHSERTTSKGTIAEIDAKSLKACLLATIRGAIDHS